MSLSHPYDDSALARKIDDTFEKFYVVAPNKTKYIGPYFVFVQSSGMGKTKILHEYKNALVVPRSLESRSSHGDDDDDDAMQDGKAQHDPSSNDSDDEEDGDYEDGDYEDDSKDDDSEENDSDEDDK